MSPAHVSAKITPHAAPLRKLMTVIAAAVQVGDLILVRDQFKTVAQADVNLAHLYGGKYPPVQSYHYRFEPTGPCGGESLTVKALSAVTVCRLIPPEAESA
jgi:hypothetical protein